MSCKDLSLYIFGIIVAALFMVCGFLGLNSVLFYSPLFIITSIAFAVCYFATKEEKIDKWFLILDILMFLVMIPIALTVIITVFKVVAFGVTTSIFYALYVLGFIYKMVIDIKPIIKKQKNKKEGNAAF